MDKKIRYLLLTGITLLFLILAPVVVLYVRGEVFDFQTKQFVQTGILALRAEPKDTQVFLDGQLVSNSAKDLKFLFPKDYDIQLKKTGYQTWQKRLSVAPAQVTWASPTAGNIFLFLTSPEANGLAGQIQDFYFWPKTDTLAALGPDNLVILSATNPNNGSTLALPKTVSVIAAASPDGTQLMLQAGTSSAPTNLYVNLSSRQITDLSALFNGPVAWQFSGNRLYALNNENLYQVAPANSTKKLLQTKVEAMTFLNNDLYLLKEATSTSALEVTPDPAEPGQDILAGLPEFKQAQIIVSFEKQIFLMADGTLYEIGGNLEPLSSNVTAWNFDSDSSSLVFFHDGELDYFNPFDNNVHFISRSGGELGNPLLRLDMSQSFFTDGNTVKALELDTRDHQNGCDLYRGTDVKKIALSGDGKTLIVLDGNDIKAVTIR